MLWFTFKVTFGTIPAGWLAGKEMIIILPQVQLELELELGLELGKKLVLNYKYIYTISYGVDMMLLDVMKCLYLIFYFHPDC
jgi:hypothetical protein